MLANRIAFFGFNAVRLHNMDSSFEPRGIFKDVCADIKDTQMKKTGILNEDQLEKLDYLIYQLKIRGIYIDMNLLVGRRFVKADGVVNADALKAAAKPASMFDPTLIKLQEQYARDLLTHKNKYTNLRYCDDPAMALVEITNENSIVYYWRSNILNGTIYGLKKDPLPDDYVKELDKKWREWLKIKYGTAADISAKRPIYKIRQFYNQQTVQDAENFYTDLEKKYFKEMTDFLKKDVGVKSPITGSQYSSHVAQESCDFIDTHVYWDHPYFPNQAWDDNDFKIAGRSIFSDKSLSLIGEIKTNAPMAKPYTITEWNHCYPNQYAYETPPLLACEALKNDWDALFQFAFAGVPITTDKIVNYFDIAPNTQQLLLCSIGSLIYNKSILSRFHVEGGVAIFDHELLRGVVGAIKDREYTLSPLKIKSSSDGAMFIFSPKLTPLIASSTICIFSVGPIKNSGSGWLDGKTFSWGQAPVLLKSTKPIISSDRNAALKINGLDNSGGIAQDNNNDAPWYLITVK
ncbi:MAG: hypothetical protein PHI59_00880 [Candidatus Omnitrophica bacterium]|nr:hypothetical protein [Candidatus Omnitrophota bacterium]